MILLPTTADVLALADLHPTAPFCLNTSGASVVVNGVTYVAVSS